MQPLLHASTDHPATLVELLRWRASHQPSQRAYTFLTDETATETHLTYAELDYRARAIGAWLQQLGVTGERALLLYPPGLDYVAAFLGCLYAGVVAVPAYPPRLNRPMPRLQAIVVDAQATMVLTTTSILTTLEGRLAHAPELERLRWVATDSLANNLAETWQPPQITPETLVFLQYTSGSTATPKGVMLSHRNLLYNLFLIQQCFENTPESRGVIWLPPYHDMGLIGGVLQPLYVGFPVALIPPVAFLQNPLSWLRAVSQYQATASGGPNFAYELCLDKISPEQRAQLDLSSWQVAFTGAEPIRAETLARFAETFAPCGFRPEAFYPCYGLAEATLIVSGGRATTPPVVKIFSGLGLEQNVAVEARGNDKHNRTLVGCGQNLTEQKIVIAHPEMQTRCAPGQVGEIWVAGPSIAQGYWNKPEETQRTFQAQLADTGEGPFLRTGDLGVWHQGELFITGRIKDLIIIRGRNHYPQDIELTVEGSHEALRPGAGAAFSVEINGEERLVITQEIRPQYRKSLAVEAIASAIRQAVSAHHELQVYAVLLLKAGSIPKTSSGKIQRHACRAGFENSSLEVVGQSVLDTQPDTTALPSPKDSFIRQAIFAVQDTTSRQILLALYLQEQVARTLKVSPAQVNQQQPLTTLGLDSLSSVELIKEIDSDLGVALSVVDLLDGATLHQLATQILTALNALESGAIAAGPHAAPRPLTPPTLRPVPRAENLALSFSQQRLWFIDRLAAGNSAYNLSVAVRLTGRLDPLALTQSITEIIRRHETLRTTFQTVAGQPTQIIAPPYALDLPSTNLSGLTSAAWESEVKRLAEEETRRPFDLSQGPLLRARLLYRNAETQVLLLTLHHIISDGWSMGVFLREIAALYQTFSTNTYTPLPELPIQYADYADWQRQWLQGETLEHLAAYWQEQLAGMPAVLPLPTDRTRPPTKTFQGNDLYFSIPAELQSSIQDLGRAEGVTLFMILLATLKVMLHYYCHRDDIVVGTNSANRHWAQTENLIGLFVNQLVLRTDLSGNPPFQELLKRVQQTTLGAYAHQDLPFDKLVEILKPERNPSYNPLFQVSLVLENAPLPALELAGLKLSLLEVESGAAPFDFSLIISEAEHGLSGLFRYSTDLFETQTIARMVEHYQMLLATVVTQPQATLQDLHRLLAEIDHRQHTVKVNRLKESSTQKFKQIKRRT